MSVSIKRHIAKTITWRIVGTIDTIILGWLISGNWKVGITIGSFEVITKMVLYFLHERMWYKFKFGINND
jgi:adenylylsulfate kinase